MPNRGIKRLKEYLKEAKEFLERGDVVQSSEKLYKIVEDGIKLLAKKYKMKSKRRRWLTLLLRKAAFRLSFKLNLDLRVSSTCVWFSRGDMGTRKS